MDILSLFRSSPEKQIAKLRKKVKEPHGEASVRVNAAYKLYQMGGAQAISALLERFKISVAPLVQDEEEKADVLSWIVSFGEEAVQPLMTFLKRERQVYWPIQALQKIVSEEEFVQRLTGLLLFLWENPPAGTEQPVQLLRAAVGHYSPRLQEAVLHYLEDKDDDVLLAALEFLFQCPEAEVREPVLECYLESEERPRIRSSLLEKLCRAGWSVRGYRPRIEETLPTGFSITREGKLRMVGRSY